MHHHKKEGDKNKENGVQVCRKYYTRTNILI
jgi:hypothetical protein